MLLAPIPWTIRVGGAVAHGPVALGALFSATPPCPPPPVGPRTASRVASATLAAGARAGRGVGDPAYAALEWLEAVRHAVGTIPRLRLAAALYAPAPPRQPRPHGRPRQQGKRLPPLEQVLTHATTRWTTVTVANWYGATTRRVQITSETAVWSRAGTPVGPMRWVGIRDPAGRFAPQPGWRRPRAWLQRRA
jgi:hypothetical protein